MDTPEITYETGRDQNATRHAEVLPGRRRPT